jgi:hypothetical protein
MNTSVDMIDAKIETINELITFMVEKYDYSRENEKDDDEYWGSKYIKNAENFKKKLYDAKTLTAISEEDMPRVIPEDIISKMIFDYSSMISVNKNISLIYSEDELRKSEVRYFEEKFDYMTEEWDKSIHSMYEWKNPRTMWLLLDEHNRIESSIKESIRDLHRKTLWYKAIDTFLSGITIDCLYKPQMPDISDCFVKIEKYVNDLKIEYDEYSSCDIDVKRFIYAIWTDNVNIVSYYLKKGVINLQIPIPDPRWEKFPVITKAFHQAMHMGSIKMMTHIWNSINNPFVNILGYHGIRIVNHDIIDYGSPWIHNRNDAKMFLAKRMLEKEWEYENELNVESFLQYVESKTISINIYNFLIEKDNVGVSDYKKIVEMVIQNHPRHYEVYDRLITDIKLKTKFLDIYAPVIDDEDDEDDEDIENIGNFVLEDEDDEDDLFYGEDEDDIINLANLGMDEDNEDF